MSQITFERLGLPADLVKALAAQRISEPFAIQGLTLPDALAGRDILGRAPTGSGKTLAFGLPALARLGATDRAAKRRPRGLILSPTRELAEQIQRELAPLATAVGRRVAAVYGGASAFKQIRALSKGVDLLVACPGRLLDLMDQGEVSIDQVEVAVVDEADRMADMGFLPDVRRLLDQTMNDRQTLLFSATLDGDVQELIDRYQHEPALHEIGDPEPDLSLVEHRFIKVAKNARIGVAADLITDAGSTVVFVRTRHGVDRLARQLKQRGVRAGHIHGGRSQSQRSRALGLFTDGKVDALVATDVAARGIHVDGVACVLHYDPPAETKDYVHRSGRTARAGAEGTVISLLDPAQVKGSRKMQRELGIDADIEPAPPTRSRPDIDISVDSGPPKARKNADGEGSRPGNKAGHSRRARARNKAEHDGSRSRNKAEHDGSRARNKAEHEGSRSRGKAEHDGSRARNRSERDGSGARKKRGAHDKPRAGKPADGDTSRARGGAEGDRPQTRKKAAGSGKARSRKASTGPRSTKRSGRSRPPNRKGKMGAKGRRSGGSQG